MAGIGAEDTGTTEDDGVDGDIGLPPDAARK